MTSLTTHRRSFIKWLAAAPVLATIAGRDLSNKLSAAVGKSTANVYERIGVRPFINARGTWTLSPHRHGGSLAAICGHVRAPTRSWQASG